MSKSGARRFAHSCKSTQAFGAIFRPSQRVQIPKIAKVETPRQRTQSIFAAGASTSHGFFVQVVRLHGPWLCLVEFPLLLAPPSVMAAPSDPRSAASMAEARWSWSRFGSVLRPDSILLIFEDVLGRCSPQLFKEFWLLGRPKAKSPAEH